jgi:hypothetical protein
MNPTSQQKKKFEEERARRILLYLFPEKYGQTTLSEAPDIITNQNNIGIEVTSSMVGYNQNGLADFRSGEEAANPGVYLASFVFWGVAHNIESIFNKKLRKLNSPHYHLFNENNLFIYAWLIDDAKLQNGISAICNKIHSLKNAENNTGDYKLFDHVYIITGRQLVALATTDCHIKRYDLSSAELSMLSQEAFTEIFGMSREAYYNSRQIEKTNTV